MITIDGSRGEGGGQVLRTALGLSLVTGTPFRISNIRAGRQKPGLLRQHLTGVRAAAEIGGADVSGDALGSRTLSFRPRGVRPGNYAFDIGSAGSASLVLQTVLPALLSASGPTSIKIEGGTHNPLAPPFEFLNEAFAPVLRRMGAKIEVALSRYGFAPAGGGCLEARVEPAKLSPLALCERGEARRRSARAIVSSVPEAVARRELEVIQKRLGFAPSEVHMAVVASAGPGNTVWVTLEHEHVTEVFVAFGERRLSAEKVAHNVCSEVHDYLATDAPVGAHLADQLLIPLALAGEGVFRTTAPTGHTQTQLELIPEFLDVAFTSTEEATGVHRIELHHPV
jgi:RNA 3'-terminal phosphate cyclase (ATP)